SLNRRTCADTEAGDMLLKAPPRREWAFSIGYKAYRIKAPRESGGSLRLRPPWASGAGCPAPLSLPYGEGLLQDDDDAAVGLLLHAVRRRHRRLALAAAPDRDRIGRDAARDPGFAHRGGTTPRQRPVAVFR